MNIDEQIKYLESEIESLKREAWFSDADMYESILETLKQVKQANETKKPTV